MRSKDAVLLVEDVIRRAHKAGRNLGEDQYEVTTQDAKLLRSEGIDEVKWRGGKVAVFDKAAGTISLIKKPRRSPAEVVPKPETPADEPRTFEEEFMSDDAGMTALGDVRTVEPAKSKRRERKPKSDVEDLDDELGTPEPVEVVPSPEEGVTDDALVWIGSQGYPSIEDFIEEARHLGISKRISGVPREVVPGKTRVFLVHDEGFLGDAVIFGYFVVEAIEMIVNDVKDVPNHLKERIRPVTVREARQEPERGCGWRHDVGGTYLVARTDVQTSQNTNGTDIQLKTNGGQITLFGTPRDYNTLIDAQGRRFRSIKRVDGNAIVNSKALKTNPLSRAKETVKLDTVPGAGADWTKEEIDTLKELVASSPSKMRAFRDFARQTNRTPHGVSYSYYKAIRREKETTNDEETKEQ